MGEKCGSDMGGEMVVETTPTSPVLAMVLVQQKNSLLKMYVYTTAEPGNLDRGGRTLSKTLIWKIKYKIYRL
jgi:hypothetical protein